MLLGGTVFSLLEEEAGMAACVEMAARPPEGGGAAAIESAFGRSAAEVERQWRSRLDELRAA